MLSNKVKLTFCQTEITAKWNDVEADSNTHIAPLITLSFDIECDSLTGAFPQAIKNFIKPSQDVLTTYYGMIKNYDSYTVEEKILLINEIVLNLYKKKAPINWGFFYNF